MRKSTLIGFLLLSPMLMANEGCEPSTADYKDRLAQEQLQAEATSQTGMPAIHNFRERKLLKDILELRDQDGLVTYTYVFNELQGKFIFFCNSVGYGIPYATQYTNPEKPVWPYHDSAVIAQADPNGLFSPEAAEGTWVLCSDPSNPKSDAKVVYIEPRIITTPFQLSDPTP